MVKKIRVTVTETYEYEPQLDEGTYYTDYNVTTVDGALELDSSDVESGKCSIYEIADNPILRGYKWEIIDA